MRGYFVRLSLFSTGRGDVRLRMRRKEKTRSEGESEAEKRTLK